LVITLPFLLLKAAEPEEKEMEHAHLKSILDQTIISKANELPCHPEN
jgi:hypothetical protein